MASISLRDLRGASLRARRWLEQAATPTPGVAALRELGLTLCRRIRGGRGGPFVSDATALRLPALADFVKMGRGERLALAQRLSLSDASTWRAGKEQRHLWAKVFGGAALSYAREGDLLVVASLVRAAARLELRGPWLTEAMAYVLDQQHPDGYFGLLAPELALLGGEDDGQEARLRLTVEALWAMSEFCPRG